jgi:subtilisin family serine protease
MSRKAVRRLCVVAGVALATLCISQVASAAPPGTNTAASEAAACASLYGVPASVGPEPLSACQWDMRAIGATPAGSYPVNQGNGARIGDIDTGIDLTNGDIMPNVDVASSCVFLYAHTPTANPAEQVTRGDCSNKAALQDLAGHGTHTAGIMAAPINGIGVSGVAPKAKIVVLKAGTELGFLLHRVGRRRVALCR